MEAPPKSNGERDILGAAGLRACGPAALNTRCSRGRTVIRLSITKVGTP
jgi:hypothetical protein